MSYSWLGKYLKSWILGWHWGQTKKAPDPYCCSPPLLAPGTSGMRRKTFKKEWDTPASPPLFHTTSHLLLPNPHRNSFYYLTPIFLFILFDFCLHFLILNAFLYMFFGRRIGTDTERQGRRERINEEAREGGGKSKRHINIKNWDQTCLVVFSDEERNPSRGWHLSFK